MTKTQNTTPKFRFEFSGVAGDRSVIATTEVEARHLAMVDRWGKPTGIYGNSLGQYSGNGLHLLSRVQLP